MTAATTSTSGQSDEDDQFLLAPRLKSPNSKDKERYVHIR